MNKKIFFLICYCFILFLQLNNIETINNESLFIGLSIAFILETLVSIFKELK